MKEKKVDKKNIEDILALTPLQEGMLFHYLKEPGSTLYFEQLSLGIDGEIDIDCFEKAWNVVLKNNEMLRTLFRWEKLKRPAQVVLKHHTLKPAYYEYSGQDKTKKREMSEVRENNEKKQWLEGIKARDRKNKFDLQEVPFRITLCKIGEPHLGEDASEDNYQMIISNHHILYDGWSNGIILKEFFEAYNTLSKGQKLTTPAKTKFKEFVRWTQSQQKDEAKKFWKDYLKEFTPSGAFSLKKKSPTQGDGKTGNVEPQKVEPGKSEPEESEPEESEHYRFVLDRGITKKLEQYAGSSKLTPASVLYTAWGLLLQKYDNNREVAFGTTVSGRKAKVKGIEEMVGLFINTLPLIVKTTPKEKNDSIIQRVDGALKQREPFENTPLLDIKEYHEIDNIDELFDTILVIENYPLDKKLAQKEGKLSVTGYSMEEASHYVLTLGITVFNGIQLNFVYDSASFETQSIHRLARHFQNIVKQLVYEPDERVSAIEMITGEEKKQILYEYNATAAEYPQNQTIHQLFRRQADAIPDSPAVVGMEAAETVTYGQLSRKAAHQAELLRQKGIQPGSIVALLLERSVEMLGTLLGILEAGCAYLPIDPGYPAERINYMLADSNTPLLVTTRSLAQKITKPKDVIYCDEMKTGIPPDSKYNGSKQRPPDHPDPAHAYVIYTS
ncbi:MAG: AMP-binding protein, partial [bacterium]|nr:AMP-binding protein [bacterium]